MVRLVVRIVFVFLIFAGLSACNPPQKESNKSDSETYPDIQIVGAMKDVMWNGELGGKIALDTIANKNGLYGLGPLSYLQGELLINDGKSFVSKVSSDSTMSVESTYEISAPFFVYGNVTEWHQTDLPLQIKTIKALEKYIDEQTSNRKRPFVFKVIGKVSHALIHIQNLPEGTTVSSPQEAHQGQTNYELKNEEVEVIGFFSTQHKGVFTHHDSNVHMHLITKDHAKMGHLDQMEIGEMRLYLPEY